MRSVIFDMHKNLIRLIDQRKLPASLEFYECKDYEDVIFAINEMVVRGAPAIGALAAYGLAQSSINGANIKEIAEKLRDTRPTGRDLNSAIDHLLDDEEEIVERAINWVEELVESCRKLSVNGRDLLNGNVLTHCNAGALATVDYGTSLGVIRESFLSGRIKKVLVSETRPRLQGSRLTAWELENWGIPYEIIADSASGYLCFEGEVDCVITGADAITRERWAINKIGTYEKALAAKANRIPFYVAAPRSTFTDLSYKDVIIEERRGEEFYLFCKKSDIMPADARLRNPAFDITPRELITGIISEDGIE